MTATVDHTPPGRARFALSDAGCVDGATDQLDAHAAGPALVDDGAAGDSLWRSAPLLVVLLVVAAGALLPSFVAVREYAAHVGAHRELIWGAPLCLDGLALSAAYAWIDRHARGMPAGSAPWSAVGAALATLAVNALHANPRLLDPVVGLVALSLLAPIAAFAAFHLVFESLTGNRNVARDNVMARERHTARRTLDDAADAAVVASPTQRPQRGPVRAQPDIAVAHATPRTSRNDRAARNGDDAAEAAVVASPAQRPQRAPVRAQPAAQTSRGDTHTRITRTVATQVTETTELVGEVTDDTARQIVADWLADGGDIHDPDLTTRVEHALGKSRRTAQLHLQPARQAAATTIAARTP